MAAGVWYEGYDQLAEEVQRLKEQYEKRCLDLGVSPAEIRDELWREMIARIVHESNWQEEYKLNLDRTRELADTVFDNPIAITGPRLDMNGIANVHRESVLIMKREGKAPEEIAAYNLSRAHLALTWISTELSLRHLIMKFAAMEGLRKAADKCGNERLTKFFAENPDVKEVYELLEDLSSSDGPVYAACIGDISTFGDLVQKLRHIEFDSLRHPMNVEYIHFLHRLTTLGLIQTRKCGVFRTTQVHIPGNLDLYFPSPLLVPGMMDEFCKRFPLIYPTTGSGRDVILSSAKVSHAFVSIHPYADGNGRLSRLLMNLVIRRHYLPVYLKADKKGRHRYIQALKRADRGNIKPLACLIARSLKAIYKRLIASVSQ